MASVYETMTQEQRTERARKAARAKWDKTEDRLEATAAARAAADARFTSNEERSAYFRALAARSVESKRAAKHP